jgi:protein-S-isoprenylcysteine O-methyltransferase Ste14
MKGFVRALAGVLYASVWLLALIVLTRGALLDKDIGFIRQTLLFLIMLAGSILMAASALEMTIGHLSSHTYAVEQVSLKSQLLTSLGFFVFLGLLLSLVAWKLVFPTCWNMYDLEETGSLLWGGRYAVVLELPMYIGLLIVLLLRRSFSGLDRIEDARGIPKNW